jgi:hypothetical protein
MWFRSVFDRFLARYAQNSTSIKFQTLLVLINSLVLGVLVYHGMMQTGKIFDPAPTVTPVRPQKTYIQHHQIPTDVMVGMTINDFSSFDLTKNKFVIRAIVWFIFDPIFLSIETMNQFSFSKGTILKRSAPEITITHNKKAFAKYEVLAEFNTDLDYRYFPLDNHRIFIALTNLAIDESDVIFKSQNSYFKIDDHLHTASGRIINLQTRYGVSRSELIPDYKNALVERPLVVFSFDYNKPGVRSTLLIIIPIILMFFMSLFTLSLDPTVSSREIFATSIGVLTSILTYRFVIESLSPQVDYFTMGDYVYIFVLLCAFGLFLFNSLSIRIREFTQTAKIIRMTLLISLHIIMAVFMYLTLNYWI